MRLATSRCAGGPELHRRHRSSTSAAELPEARLVLIVGGDSFAALPTWRGWRRILERLAEIAVLERPGRARPRASSRPELRRLAGRARLVANAPVEVSSTEVRRAIAAGEPSTSGTVPPLVLDYIAKYRPLSTSPSRPARPLGTVPGTAALAVAVAAARTARPSLQVLNLAGQRLHRATS